MQISIELTSYENTGKACFIFEENFCLLKNYVTIIYPECSKN